MRVSQPTAPAPGVTEGSSQLSAAVRRDPRPSRPPKTGHLFVTAARTLAVGRGRRELRRTQRHLPRDPRHAQHHPAVLLRRCWHTAPGRLPTRTPTIRALGPPAEHALISLLALNGLRVSEATGADIERTEGPVFLAAGGQRLDRHGATRIVRRATRRAGISKHVSPHTLRHAFITAAQMSNVASSASFSGFCEHALPAVQHATRWRSQRGRARCSARDLGCQQLVASGARMRHLI